MEQKTPHSGPACTSGVATLQYYIACMMLICNLLLAKPCHAVIPAHLPMVYLAENCDKVDLQGMRKLLVSTQREDLYANNIDCTLLLSVRGGFIMRFAFEHLDLPEPVSGHCEDSVQLYNGYTRELLLTRPICGSIANAPQVFVSNHSEVALRFRTNSKNQHSGFRLSVERLAQTKVERMGCSRDQTAGCSVVQSDSSKQDLKPPAGSCVHQISLYSWPVAIVGLVVAWALIMFTLIRR